MSDERVVVDAQAAEDCARACETFASSMRDIVNAVGDVGHYRGFGTLPSGVALAAKYAESTRGGPGSLTFTLDRHAEVAMKLADTFRRMGEQYVETDDAAAASLRPSDTGGR